MASREAAGRARVATTKAAILAACRELMLDGELRPTLEAACDRAGYSKRSGFGHFASVEKLREVALEDPHVRAAVLTAVVGPPPSAFACSEDVALRIVRAVVIGKPVA